MELGRGYALLDDKLIHISNLNENQRGLNCGCQCPGCKEPVVARMGEKNRHHFAHQSVSGSYNGVAHFHSCNPDSVNETITHRMAKEIIEEHGYCYLPEMTMPWNEIRSAFPDCEDRVYNYKRAETVHLRNKGIVRGTVRLEQPVSVGQKRIIPDVIMTTESGSQILIEIAVFHKIDEKKYTKIKEQDLAVVEFNCKHIGLDPEKTEDDQLDYLRKVLTKILIDGKHGANVKCRWINCGSDWRAVAVKKMAKRIEQATKEVEWYRKKADSIFSPEAQKAYADEMQTKYAGKIKYVIDNSFCLQKYPSLRACIGVPIPCDEIVDSPREIWQLKILDSIIRKYFDENFSSRRSFGGYSSYDSVYPIEYPSIRSIFLDPSFYSNISDEKWFYAAGYGREDLSSNMDIERQTYLEEKLSRNICDYYLTYLSAVLGAKYVTSNPCTFELEMEMIDKKLFCMEALSSEFLLLLCKNPPESSYAYEKILVTKTDLFREELLEQLRVAKEKEFADKAQKEIDAANKTYSDFIRFGFSSLQDETASSLLRKLSSDAKLEEYFSQQSYHLGSYHLGVWDSGNYVIPGHYGTYFFKLLRFLSVLPILGESFCLKNITPRRNAYILATFLSDVLSNKHLTYDEKTERFLCSLRTDFQNHKNWQIKYQSQCPDFLRNSTYHLVSPEFFYYEQILYTFYLLGLIDGFTLDLNVYQPDTNEVETNIICSSYKNEDFESKILEKIQFIMPLCEKYFHQPDQGAKEVVYALLHLKYGRIDPEDCPYKEYYFDSEPNCDEYIKDVEGFIYQDFKHSFLVKHNRKLQRKEKRVKVRRKKARKRFRAFKKRLRQTRQELFLEAKRIYESTTRQPAVDNLVEKWLRIVKEEQEETERREARRIAYEQELAEKEQRRLKKEQEEAEARKTEEERQREWEAHCKRLEPLVNFWANRIKTTYQTNSAFAFDFIDLDIKFNHIIPPEIQERTSSKELLQLALIALEGEGKLTIKMECSSSYTVDWT